MKNTFGIRREDKNPWERRVPFTPKHVKELIEKHSLNVSVQPSEIRVFPEEEYTKAGATIQEDLSACSVVFAVKEIPSSLFREGKTYMYFSHTIKGQDYNMPMLAKLMELKCQLIDYEKVTDEKNRRLIFFGNYAGLAGIIDSFWALGRRFESEGLETQFKKIRQANTYDSLEEAKREIAEVGKAIEKDGLPESVVPLVVGFSGYGQVSIGAQEISDLLPTIEVTPENLEKVNENPSRHHIYKVVFKESDMVVPVSSDITFELQDYYDHPEKYRSQFDRYIPHLSVLMNCIYWEPKYPRLITKEYLKKQYSLETGTPRLRVIGDISCDIDGSVECTQKCTDTGNPIFVYEPLTEKVKDGVSGNGPIILSVDNLPCELPRESSTFFGNALLRFVAGIMAADYTKSFDECELPPEIKKAVIVYQGELTPDFKYLEKFLP